METREVGMKIPNPTHKIKKSCPKIQQNILQSHQNNSDGGKNNPASAITLFV